MNILFWHGDELWSWKNVTYGKTSVIYYERALMQKCHLVCYKISSSDKYRCIPFHLERSSYHCIPLYKDNAVGRPFYLHDCTFYTGKTPPLYKNKPIPSWTWWFRTIAVSVWIVEFVCYTLSIKNFDGCIRVMCYELKCICYALF